MVKNSPNISEREDALLFPQYTATYPYPEPSKSNTRLPIFLLEDRFLILSYSLGILISNGLSSSALLTKSLYIDIYFLPLTSQCLTCLHAA